MSKVDTRVVRFAVVGLGHFAQAAILPAFANAKQNSRLAALVTGDAEKAEKLGEKYGVPAWGYERFDELMASGDVDVVYVAFQLNASRVYRACGAGRCACTL